MKLSMISREIIASTIPMINTDQKAKRIMYSLSPSKKSAKRIIVKLVIPVILVNTTLNKIALPPEKCERKPCSHHFCRGQRALPRIWH